MNDKNEASPTQAAVFGRRSLARAGLEILSIVLVVLAALAVSEWQGNRNNQERTRAALGNVHTEMAKNLELLEIVHDNNASLIQQLASDRPMQHRPMG